MPKYVAALFLLLMLVAGRPDPALAREAIPLDQPPAGADGLWFPAPRYMVYEAPRPYGGLVLLDTATGASYQRLVVNTPTGIKIRWLKIEKVDALKPGETILWD